MAKTGDEWWLTTDEDGAVSVFCGEAPWYDVYEPDENPKREWGASYCVGTWCPLSFARYFPGVVAPPVGKGREIAPLWLSEKAEVPPR